LRKGVADRLWEDLVLAIIGDQFDDCRGKLEDNSKTKSGVGKSEDGSEGAEWPEICGCTISVRQSEDVITVWNRVDGDPMLREQIRWVSSLRKVAHFPNAMNRDTLRKVLNLLPSTVMEYKSNNGKRWLARPAYHYLTSCATVQTLCKTGRVSGEQHSTKR
jgi:translation initiation factor 4E